MRPFKQLSLIVSIVAGVASAQVVPPEELTLRAAYAKLSLAVKLSTLRAQLAGIPSNNNASELSVEIGDVQVGMVDNIANRQVTDFLSEREGLVLKCLVDMWAVATPDGSSGPVPILDVSWETALPNLPNRAGALSEAVKDVRGEYITYATADVKLSFRGRQRQYLVLFLYGLDSAGKRIVFPGDSVVGVTALDSVIRGSVSPTPFFLRGFGSDPGLMDFIKSETSSPACVNDQITRLCCDLKVGTCGIPAGVSPSTQASNPASGNSCSQPLLNGSVIP